MIGSNVGASSVDKLGWSQDAVDGCAGASINSASSTEEALRLINFPSVSAAVVDINLGDAVEVMTGIGPVAVRQPRVRDRGAAVDDPARIRFTPLEIHRPTGGRPAPRPSALP